MFASITTGTTKFLKNFIESHQKIDFYLMKHGATTLIYYEHKRKKSVFVSGKSYSIIKQHGQVQQIGFVSMHHVPVMDDVKTIFEEKISAPLETMKQVTGVSAIRLLQPIKNNTYVIFIIWNSEKNFQRWERTKMDFSTLVRQPAYFGERAFTQTFRMLKEDENEIE